MAQVVRVRCVLCGQDRPLAWLGLTADGAFDPATARVHEASLRIDEIGGRGRLAVQRLPLPLPIAQGLRDALASALARLDEDIAAALPG